MSSSLNQTPPLALTDAELDQIMRYAAPLHPRVRRLFVETVASCLLGKVLGDGAVYRACREVLRESGMFDAPVISNPQHRPPSITVTPKATSPCK